MSQKAVVFDLDGTLADTLEDLAASANHALHQLGVPTHPTAAFRQYVGDGVVVLARRVLPPGRDDLVEPAIEGFRRHYAEHWSDRTRPYEGVPELLDGLAARGIPMAVLSNKPDDFTREMVAAFFGRWDFRAVVGHRRDCPPKPDPAGATAVARALAVPPADCLYVGDTHTDMRTAVAAGMVPIGVSWGFRDREELVAHGARVVIDTPTDLLRLVDEGV